MAMAVNPNQANTAIPTPDVTAAVNTAAQRGVAQTPDSLEAAQTNAPAPAESKGFCAQIGAFFKGIADSIASFFSSIFSKIKTLFVKAEISAGTTDGTTDGTTAGTSLEAFRTFLDSGATRDQVVAAFELLDLPVQDNVKGTMWEVAGQHIQDIHDVQDDERHDAPDWAGRVIHGQLRVDGEAFDRPDIARYADITDPGSLFRVAVDQVIAAPARVVTA